MQKETKTNAAKPIFCYSWFTTFRQLYITMFKWILKQEIATKFQNLLACRFWPVYRSERVKDQLEIELYDTWLYSCNMQNPDSKLWNFVAISFSYFPIFMYNMPLPTTQFLFVFVPSQFVTKWVIAVKVRVSG